MVVVVVAVGVRIGIRFVLTWYTIFEIDSPVVVCFSMKKREQQTRKRKEEIVLN